MSRLKVQVAKAKQRAYDDLYVKLYNKEGKAGLYRLAGKRDEKGCATG